VFSPNGPDDTSAATRIATARTARDVSSRKQTLWQDARLIDIIAETSDAVTLRLRLEDSVDFLPGQYYNVRLVCASSSFDNSFYHRELTDLAEQYPWLEVVHTFTRDSMDVRATHHRRIDHRMVADAVTGQSPRHVYICGPPAMVEDVQCWLGELGVEPTRVRVEKYD